MFGLCAEQLIAGATLILAITAIINARILVINCRIARSMVRATKEASENMLYLEFARERMQLIKQTALLADSFMTIKLRLGGPDILDNDARDWAAAMVVAGIATDDVKAVLAKIFVVISSLNGFVSRQVRDKKVTDAEWAAIGSQGKEISGILITIVGLLRPDRQGFLAWAGRREELGKKEEK